MALISCTACNEQISEMAYDCPKCGHSLKKPKRTFFGKIIKWVFILFNILMLIAIINGLNGGGEVIDNADNNMEEAGAVIGTAIGATMLFLVWFFGDVILGLFVLFTRPKK
jgi:hypothetical protein